MEAEGSGSSGLSSPLLLPPPTVADVPPTVNTGRAERDELDSGITDITNNAGHPKESHPLILPLLLLVLYAMFGITTHRLSCRPEHSTCSLVDSIYFTVVTLCTTGYGDIVPQSSLAKILTVFLLLAGFVVIDIWLNNRFFQSIFDWMESVLVKMKLITVEEGEAATTRTNMWVSLGIVACCIVIGTIAILCFEGLDLVDSVYLSVASVTTVGYGDFSFKTFGGRLFAIVWLSLSTSAVSRAVSCISAYSLLRKCKVNQKHSQEECTEGKEKFLENVQSAKEKFIEKVHTAAKAKSSLRW